MFKFDLMKFSGYSNRRLYFSSRRNNNVYYFEFSWNYIKFIFDKTKIKYVGLVY